MLSIWKLLTASLWNPVCILYLCCCCSVAKSCPTSCDSMDCSRLGSSVLHSPGVCSNSCLLSQWCNLTILSSATPFFFCLHSFPAWGSFPMSQLFAFDDQRTGASASATVLPTNIQGWYLLGLIGLISLLSKSLSRVFSSTTVWNHQFYGALHSLWSSSHIHTWLLEKQ